MIVLFLIACAISRSVAVVSTASVDKPAVPSTTFGPIEAKDGQYSGTPSIFRCVVANGYVTVVQDLSVPIPADLPAHGWCGEPGAETSIRFDIVRPK
jgi:hypothetical protein